MIGIGIRIGRSSGAAGWIDTGLDGYNITNFAANQTNGGVLLTWVDAEGTSGNVLIYARIDGAAEILVATINAGVQTYLHEITGNHTIVYRIVQEIVEIVYCDQYVDVYEQFTEKPSAEVAFEQDKMIKAILSAGGWEDNIDAFWLFSGHTNGDSESLINWKSPTSERGVLAGVTPPSFTSYQGFTGDGLTSYINLKWNPNDDGITYSVNSASVLLCIKNAGSKGRFVGANKYIDPASKYIAIIYTGRGCLNSAYAIDGTGISAGGKAYISLIRDSAESIKQYINKGTSTDSTRAATGLPGSTDLFALADSANGTAQNFCDGTISAIVIGNFNATQKNAIIDAIDTYMISNGHGIL